MRELTIHVKASDELLNDLKFAVDEEEPLTVRINGHKHFVFVDALGGDIE